MGLNQYSLIPIFTYTNELISASRQRLASCVAAAADEVPQRRSTFRRPSTVRRQPSRTVQQPPRATAAAHRSPNAGASSWAALSELPDVEVDRFCPERLVWLVKRFLLHEDPARAERCEDPRSKRRQRSLIKK